MNGQWVVEIKSENLMLDMAEGLAERYRKTACGLLLREKLMRMVGLARRHTPADERITLEMILGEEPGE